MMPVLVLQHLSADGPAYLGHWLAARGIAVDVRNTEAGDAYPATLAEHGALAILGGEMSANDPLPSLRQAEALFREAVRDGIPTLGHCLGGQLMARALGARIGDSLAPEVGFCQMQVREGPMAQAWFGAEASHTVFQWHYEAFDLPAGALGLATSAACRHQAFAIGPHLGMQFHIELDADKLARWSRDEGGRFSGALLQHPASVHDGERMRRDGATLFAAHHALADRIYARWWAAAQGR
jgi:GMP synthase-like glutamine amidotransferase